MIFYCIVVFVCYCYSARCLITDLAEFVPLMQLNIDSNRHLLTGSIRAEVLCWGTPTNGQFAVPDYVLLADCIYYEAVCVSAASIFFVCMTSLKVRTINACVDFKKFTQLVHAF